jgi:hypothetical protein
VEQRCARTESDADGDRERTMRRSLQIKILSMPPERHAPPEDLVGIRCTSRSLHLDLPFKLQLPPLRRRAGADSASHDGRRRHVLAQLSMRPDRRSAGGGDSTS